MGEARCDIMLLDYCWSLHFGTGWYSYSFVFHDDQANEYFFMKNKIQATSCFQDFLTCHHIETVNDIYIYIYNH